MDYDKKRAIMIDLIGVAQEWAEEHGLETSGEMEHDFALRVFSKLYPKEK